MTEVHRRPHRAAERMVTGQGLERGAEIAQVLFRVADPEQATVLLHHVDPGPAVSRVDHQVHCPLRIQDVSKGAQTEVRVGKVMQHPGAHDVIERAPKLLDPLDRKVVQLEVLQIVLALEIARVAKARLADVDGDDSRIRLTERVSRRLRGAAARDEDLLASAHRLGRPQEMKQRTSTVRVPVQVAMLIQAGERRRIRHRLVEGMHLLRDS